MRYSSPGSGTYATDMFRDERAHAAANALGAGSGVLCKSADHLSAGETCVEVIARKANDPSKKSVNGVEQAAVPAAIEKLKQGFGHHVAQGNHAGGNTCAQVIAASIV